MKSEIISLETAKKIEDLERENKILNNIIDELEKWIDKNKQYQVISERCIVWEDKLIDKLNKLKGDNK